MTDYILGNRINIAVSFTDADGVAADPTTVTLYLKEHNATTETVYVYPTDAEITKDSVGEYHAVVEPTTTGWWLYRWTGEGAAVGATEGSFHMVKEYH